MKKAAEGKIDYSKLRTLPEQYEIETALYFASRGLNIEFIKPSSIEGNKSPDFIMLDRSWEIKSPITYGKSSFEYNLKKAMKQSENIIYDLRRLKKSDELKYIGELQKRAKTQRIKTLIIIRSDCEILTLKGIFGKMKSR